MKCPWGRAKTILCIIGVAFVVAGVGLVLRNRTGLDQLPVPRIEVVDIILPAHQPQPLRTLQGHASYVNCLVFVDEATLASGSSDKTVRLWDTRLGVEAVRFNRHRGIVTGIQVTRDGHFLVSSDGCDEAYCWDLTQQTAVHIPNAGVRLAVELGSGLLAFSASDRTVKLVSLVTKREESVLGRLPGEASPRIAFSADGKWLAAASDSCDRAVGLRGGSENEIRIWETHTRKEKSRIWSPDGFSSLAFSQNGKVLAAGMRDSEIRLWATDNWRPLATLIGHKHQVLSLAFAADDTVLISCGGGTFSADTDGELRIWDLRKNREMVTPLRAPKTITSLAISPNGDLLATGGRDGLINLWSLEKLGSGKPNARH